jgi:fructose transport system substrate-binding protein
VLVIALDSPTYPKPAVDALFATNNFNAAILIGSTRAPPRRARR